MSYLTYCISYNYKAISIDCTVLFLSKFKPLTWSYSNERLYRPAFEPVNNCIIDQSWEITASDSEGVSGRGHGKNDVKIEMKQMDFPHENMS